MNDKITTEINDAIRFFTNKFTVHTEGFSCVDNYRGWERCLKHVSSYGLEYEVFVVARKNLSEKSTFNQCSIEIGHQMDEWYL